MKTFQAAFAAVFIVSELNILTAIVGIERQKRIHHSKWKTSVHVLYCFALGLIKIIFLCSYCIGSLGVYILVARHRWLIVWSNFESYGKIQENGNFIGFGLDAHPCAAVLLKKIKIHNWMRIQISDFFLIFLRDFVCLFSFWLIFIFFYFYALLVT